MNSINMNQFNQWRVTHAGEIALLVKGLVAGVLVVRKRRSVLVLLPWESEVVVYGLICITYDSYAFDNGACYQVSFLSRAP